MPSVGPTQGIDGICSAYRLISEASRGKRSRTAFVKPMLPKEEEEGEQRHNIRDLVLRNLC
jgi:hypothetical protein